MSNDPLPESTHAPVHLPPERAGTLILCNGMVRSASTWSYNVVMKLLRSAVGEGVYGGYNENVANFLESVPPSASYRVLKCHTLDPVGRAMVETGEAKVVFTCRNVADAVVSFMRMFDFDFEHTYSALASSLELYQFHRRRGQALILGYQEITSRPVESVAKIAAHLGIAAPAEVVQRVADETSLEQARAKVKQLETELEGDRLVRVDRFVYDPETLLNLNHVRDGRSGYGRKSLTEEEAARIDVLIKQYDFDVE
jgi:Sulfotransferase domain